MQLYSDTYIDNLLRTHSYEALVEFASMICSCSRFNQNTADYDLPTQMFVFVESLSWFAMACRSGVITYFESTPVERQAAMISALNEGFPHDFVTQYSFGAKHWNNSSDRAQLDKWMNQNDHLNNEFLHQLIEKHAPLFKQLLA